jgi:hypothetical protein
MAKSKVRDETLKAKQLMDNFLNPIMSLSMFVLMNRRVVTGLWPEAKHAVLQRRFQSFARLGEEEGTSTFLAGDFAVPLDFGKDQGHTSGGQSLELEPDVSRAWRPPAESVGSGQGGKAPPILHRSVSAEEGRLVLQLQTLHLFDRVFWPAHAGDLRNIHVLSLKTFHCFPASVAQNGAGGGDGSCPIPNPSPSPSPLSLYSVVQRVVLDVLQQLHPSHPLATTNVQRLSRLMHKKVVQKMRINTNVPITDWIFVTLSHVLVALQRVRVLLADVLEKFDISHKRDPVPGPRREAMEAQLRIALGGEEASQHLLFVEACMEFLLNAYAAGKEELSQHLGMDAFISFTLFAQQVMNSQSVLDISQLSRLSSTDEDVLDDDSEMSPERYNLEFAGEVAEDATAPSKGGLSPLLNMSHLEILQLLTQPIVDVDPASCNGVIISAFGLEKEEGASAATFHAHLQTHRMALDLVAREPHSKKFQAASLKDMAQPMETMCEGRVSARVGQRAADTRTELRHAAVQWQRCLHVFDAHWSPWISPDAQDIGSRLADHSGSTMRRMLMEHTFAVPDYSHAVYSAHRGPRACSPTSTMEMRDHVDTVASIEAAGASAIKSRDPLQQAVGAWGEEDLGGGGGGVDDDDDGDDGGGHSGDKAGAGARNYKDNDHEPPVEGCALPAWVHMLGWQPEEKFVFRADKVKRIMLDDVTSGMLLLSNRYIYFAPVKATRGVQRSELLVDERWPLAHVTEMYGRRYLLQVCAAL